jgi:hypothetical protein
MLRFVSRKAFVLPTVALAVLAMLPAVSNAGTKAGDFVLQLEGSGANTKAFNSGDFGLNLGVGYFITDAAEVSLDQGLAYAYADRHTKAPAGAGQSVNANNGDTFAGLTQLSFDWNFVLGNFVPFVGANGGVAYGTNGVKTVWEAGPEGGLKVFLNATTYIYGEVQWDLFLNHTRAAGDSEFVYGIGLGVKL